MAKPDGIVKTFVNHSTGVFYADTGLINLSPVTSGTFTDALAVGTGLTVGSGTIIIANDGIRGTNLPYVFARNSVVIAVSGGSTTPFLGYDISDFDTHSAFNNETGVFTTPFTGDYLFTGMVTLTPSVAWSEEHVLSLSINVNSGTTRTLGRVHGLDSSAQAVPNDVGGSGMFRLNAGDTVGFEIFVSIQLDGINTASNSPTFNRTYCTIKMISRE